MRYTKVSDTFSAIKKCLTLLSHWWFWTVVGLRPIPVASRQKVSDTFRNKGTHYLNRNKYCVPLILTLLLLLVVAAPAVGADTGNSEEKLAYKEVTGTVVHVGKRAISVEYAVTKDGSYEMILPFDADLKLARLRSLSELKAGDTVKVGYQQTYLDGDDGKPVVLKTVATMITLLRTAPKTALHSREDALQWLIE